MGSQATFETLLSIAIFAIPLAILITLLALLARRYLGALAPAHQEVPATERAAVVAVPVARPFATPLPPAEGEVMLQIAKKIDAAIAAGQNGVLAALYLDLADGHEKVGNFEGRMQALRAAAGYGSRYGSRASHAAARLNLAEAAYVAGDLTSACEQWQLARAAYLEDGQKELHARIEKRMRDNGCPTDWVLTDF